MKLSVTKKRTKLAAELKRALGDSFVVVAAPDHPLLIRSADVIIGGSSGVTAIMMPTAEERRRPKLFEGRLMLNAMALPPHATFIRIADHDEAGWQDKQAFAAEISLEDRDAVSDLVRLSQVSESPQRIDLKQKAQLRSESRFADTFRVARALHRSLEGQTHFKASRGRARKPLRDRFSGEIEGAFFVGSPTPAALAELTSEGAERWYQFFDDHFEPTQAPAGAVFAEEFPTSVGDPEKYLRAAAFAGWVLAPSDSNMGQQEIGELMLRYTRLR